MLLRENTSNLKLRTNSERGSSCLGFPNTFDDPLAVTLEVEGPLVEGAERKLSVEIHNDTPHFRHPPCCKSDKVTHGERMLPC